jgi:lysophospholipase L1-like esterase
MRVPVKTVVPIMAAVVFLAFIQALPASGLAQSVADSGCLTPSAGGTASGCPTTGASGTPLTNVSATVPGATTLIFAASGDFGNTEPITNLQTILDNSGWPTDVATKLPSSLQQYKAIWYIEAVDALTTSQESKLESFVRSGKSLYLTGERPCCEAVNESDQTVVDALVSGGGVGVGGVGDVDESDTPEPLNMGAASQITRSPYMVSDWTPSEPGGLSGVTGKNIVATAPDGTPTMAAWGNGQMKNGKGRLVIGMDINWLEWEYANQQLSTSLAQNIQDFLMDQSPPSAAVGASYVALGDSYASGEGSGTYISGTNTSDDKCHRASNGYAKQLSVDFGLALGFYACSGDIISDLYSSNHATAEMKTSPDDGNLGEPAQLSKLGPSTLLVTLSMGGNDTGFVPVLTDCTGGVKPNEGGTGCQDRDDFAVETNLGYLMDGRLSGCLPYLPDAEADSTSGFCGFEPSLETVYEDVAELAPNAAIYVVGYPHIFGSTFTKAGFCDVGGVGSVRYTIAKSDVAWINSETNELDQDIENMVSDAASTTGRSITFVDPRSTFHGHAVCDSGAKWINALQITAALKPTKESFHPNVTGQQKLADLLYQTVGAPPGEA